MEYKENSNTMFLSKKPIKRLKILTSALIIILILIVLDFLIDLKQEKVITEKEAWLKKLEQQAFYLISTEVRDIWYSNNIEKTNTYKALLRIDNFADEPVYISHPYLKVYIQTGKISWLEVPVQDIKSNENKQVYRVETDGNIDFTKLITINRNIPYNKNLMPRYMHLRLFIIMYILTESGFKKGEVVERRVSTFVYLKPYFVSNEEVRKVIDFGNTKVPIYMPITAFRRWNKK